MSQRLSVVQQRAEVGVHRVLDAAQLLVQVLGEHLNVACLVDHLGGGVVLGVDPRDGLDDLGGADQGALLAVQELAEAPVHRLDAQVLPFLLVQLVERRFRVLGEVGHLGGVGGGQHLVRIDVDRPVQVGLAVPLGDLRLLVELVQPGPLTLVVAPGEDGVGVVLHGVDEGRHVVVVYRELRDAIRVVGVRPEVEGLVGYLSAGHRLCRGHRGSPGAVAGGCWWLLVVAGGGRLRAVDGCGSGGRLS